MVPAKARLQRVAAHLAPTAAEGPRSRARIAVVGLGWWTTAHHMPDLDDNPAAEVVAAVEIVAERRDEVGAKYGIQTFETVDDMVAAGIELDGVVIASPHVLHFSKAAIACLARNDLRAMPPRATPCLQCAFQLVGSTSAAWFASYKAGTYLFKAKYVAERFSRIKGSLSALTTLRALTAAV